MRQGSTKHYNIIFIYGPLSFKLFDFLLDLSLELPKMLPNYFQVDHHLAFFIQIMYVWHII